MKKTRNLGAICAAAGMTVLILDGKTALSGAASGVALCLKTIIPSLFPFIFLSNLLTGSLLGSKVALLRPLGKLCHMAEGTESLLAVGFLGGYPVGAQSVASAYRSGQLSRTEAERLLPFCSNAGPSFLFGILAPMFDSPAVAWALWLIHMLSAAAVGATLATHTGKAVVSASSTAPSPAEALERAVKTIGLICGWIILFRMLLTFSERWLLWLFPISVRVIFAGFLELSNGCVLLQQFENEGMRMMAASGVLAFGGCCVLLQTRSVTEGLSLRLYFPGKLLQCAYSLLLTGLLQFALPHSGRCPHFRLILLLSLLLCVLLTRFLQTQEKTVAFPEELMYNPNIPTQRGKIYAVSKKNRAKLQLLRPRHKAG